MKFQQIFLLIILITQINLLVSDKKFTFDELGLNLKLTDSGSLYKYAILSLGYVTKSVKINWTIYWDAQLSKNSSIEIVIGFNNVSKAVKLSEKPIRESFEANLIKNNRIWLNVTIQNANLTIFGNSTVEIVGIQVSDFGGLKNVFNVIFVAGIIAPITVFVFLKILNRGKSLGEEEWEL